MPSSLDAALALWRRGLCVIPVPRPRFGVPAGTHGDGKTPAIAWKDFQTRRATEAEVREWFSREHNVAIVTGAISGVIVVDADSVEALAWVRRRLPYTPWQTETARGFHLYYAHPGTPVRNRARLETTDGTLALDVRADGGCAIAPGSLHASGRRYTFAGDWRVAREQLPTFWRGWLQRPARPAPPAVRVAPPLGGDLVRRARAYLAAIPVPDIGAGSDTAVLSAACRLVRGFGLDDATAVDLLWHWAGGRAGWTRDWVAAKVHNATRYGSEPMGAMR